MFAKASLASVRSAFAKIAPLRSTWLRSVFLNEASERLQPLQLVSPALIRATDENDVITGPAGWARPMISATAEDASAPAAKLPARPRRAKTLRIRRTPNRKKTLAPIGARAMPQ